MIPETLQFWDAGGIFLDFWMQFLETAEHQLIPICAVSPVMVVFEVPIVAIVVSWRGRGWQSKRLKLWGTPGYAMYGYAVDMPEHRQNLSQQSTIYGYIDSHLAHRTPESVVGSCDHSDL